MSEKINDLRLKKAEKQDAFVKQMADLNAKRAAAVLVLEAAVEKMSGEEFEESETETASYEGAKKAVADVDTEMAAAKKAAEDDGKVWDLKISRLEETNRLKASSAVIVPDTGPKAFAMPKVRFAKLKHFKGAEAEVDAYKSGMWALAVLTGKEKYVDFCKEHGIVVQRAASEGIGTAGGFLVPTEFSNAIIDLREEYGTFRQACRVVPMASDSIVVPRRESGLTAYFIGENDAMTESQKGWGQVALNAKKLAVLTRLSTELDEDAIISIADDLAQEIAYAFAIKEDACGWNGDGSSTYGGIVGVRTKFASGVSSLAGAVDAASGHDTFAEIDSTDIANLMAKLPKYAERNAKFYCSNVAWSLVFQRLIQASGGTTMTEMTTGKVKKNYLGYEVVIDQTLPTATTDISDTAMFLFGDLSMAARLGERRGMTLKKSDDRYFEYDQIGIQATERFDINVHDIGDTSTPGPIVAMMAE